MDYRYKLLEGTFMAELFHIIALVIQHLQPIRRSSVRTILSRASHCLLLDMHDKPSLTVCLHRAGNTFVAAATSEQVNKSIEYIIQKKMPGREK
jgi:hypothetical protein